MGSSAGPALAASAARSTGAQREYGLDFLRVFAFLVLIFYHSGMMFVSWDFHIRNAETSPLLENIMLLCNRWRLPLLFFISGAGVCFSLRRRSLALFARERMVRLFIPLVFGMLVVVPPQLYFERLFRRQFSGSYLEFYPEVFRFVPYPAGNFSWHHLWFVVYILLYSLAAIPVFALLRSERGRTVAGALAGLFERRPWALYLVNVPNLIVAFTLGPHWPTTHNLVADWANLTGAFLTFLWGFVFASEPQLLALLTRRRREFLVSGIVLYAIFFAVRLSGVSVSWPSEIRSIYGELLSAYLALTWIFAMIGYARVMITQPSPALSYANEIVYPFYIVHQTVTIAAGYYVIQTSLPLPVKLGLVAAATFVFSLTIVEGVRRVKPLRPLFGLRVRFRNS